MEEYILCQSKGAVSHKEEFWQLSKTGIKISDKKIFAPANLRAAAQNKQYAELIQGWMAEKYTLRYTGGLVPDIHHILSKVTLATTSDARHTY